ncbi:MAG: ATP-binding protein [Anaerolineales bacterium]|jgi:signal transduction histidine kinase
MRSITLKMIIAFLGIALVSIVLIVLLARWNTGTEFSRFVVDRRGADLVQNLADYYSTNGSWEGVGEIILFETVPQPSEGVPQREPFFTLVDQDGSVIYAGPGYHLGEQVRQRELDQGISIEVDGQKVGTLVMGRVPFQRNPREEEFIQRTNLMLIYSAVGASLVALLLGIFLSRTLTHPIRELTEATHAVADGELGKQVSVRSKDEMGELASSFNKMSADLARSSEARKQMTADIAHELRTPLSLILGHAEAVHDGVLPPTKENFEIIRDEAERLEKLVEDLRTLSLADAGELSITRQEVSPQKLLDDLHTTYLHIASQKNVKIQLNVASDIPRLNIDPGRMTQVLTNILDNALKHTPEGGQVKLSAGQVGDGVELSIQDSGPGIEGEDTNRIFERFYRTDTARHRDDGGSGLGLAIARSIVEMHQGQIWAESKPGQGLKIIIRFPIE